VKTIQAAGMNVKLWPTPGKPQNRNILILASDGNVDFSKADYQEKGAAPHFKNINRYLLDPSNFDLSNAVVFTDSQPQLSKVYIEVAINWRSTIRRHIKSTLYSKDDGGGKQ